MLKATEIDVLRTRWTRLLDIDDIALNQMIISAIGRVMQSHAGTHHKGNMEQLYRDCYLDRMDLMCGMPSHKTLQLLGRGCYTTKKSANQSIKRVLSKISSSMLLRVFQPLGLDVEVFFEQHLIECRTNQAKSYMPTEYVIRESLISELVDRLLQPIYPTGQAIWLTSTSTGVGGEGKSVLAAAAACNPCVKKQFFDGILWLEVGNNSISELNAKAVSLADYLCELWDESRVTTSDFVNGCVDGEWDPQAHKKQGISTLAKAIGKRHVLLVMDDVWDEEQVRWLNQSLSQCANCRLLFTTRAAFLAGVMVIPVGSMSQGEARQLLTTDLNLPNEAMPNVDRMIDYTGRWPLLLKLIKGLLAHETNAFVALNTVLERLKYRGIMTLTDISQQHVARQNNFGVVIQLKLEYKANLADFG